MLIRKSKPGPQAQDEEIQPEKDLADAALLLSLIDAGTLRTDKPLFTKTASSQRLGIEDEYELARRIQIWGDVDARNALVMANVGLVHMIVGQMLRPGYKYEDLLQEGTLGLIRATETFQADRNIRFSTYGVFWIRAKIQRFIQTHEKDDKPAMGPPKEDAAGNKQTIRARTISIDKMASAEEGYSVGDTLSSDLENPEEVALRLEKASTIKNILAGIVRELNNPHMKVILEKRILAEDPETLEELGASLHISRESCRLLESKMLKLAKEQLVNWRA
ncbi:MAG: sigma-70 family RNA polymerase sigma factor [Myxococcota bacterium]